MKAEQIIELIKTLEPSEIERFLVLIKEYEAEVRRRQTSSPRGDIYNNFKEIADQIFTENRELFQKLAEYETKERKTATK